MMRLNPHPSLEPRWDVEVVGPGRYEGTVIVRYINTPSVRWEVNEDVIEAWKVED